MKEPRPSAIEEAIVVPCRRALGALMGLVGLLTAACNSDEGTGQKIFCARYCSGLFACVDANTCVFADPEGAPRACAERCSVSFQGLTGAETELIDVCVSCLLENTPATVCPFAYSPPECASICENDAYKAAVEKQEAAFFSEAPDVRQLCTNGSSVYGATCESGVLSGAGDLDGACLIECCNGSSCGAAEVAMQCDPLINGSATCMCTKGKNADKVFRTSNPCWDVWNDCNL